MAVPFHSVDTEDEARDLVARHCAYSYNDERGPRYVMPADWRPQDVSAAVHSAARRFGLSADALGRSTALAVPEYQLGTAGVGASGLWGALRLTCEED